ncbi:MAG: histidine phosphatase family protein [Chloroflexota bacterium]
MTELWLVRHGQTVGNIQGTWQGWAEGELTPLGEQQAEATARHLAALDRPFDVLYSSPLRRAWRTAGAIGRALGLTPTAHEGLKEICFGKVEGLTLQEFQTRFPETYQHWTQEGDLSFTWPGGENRQAFHQRVWQAIEEIVARHQGQRMLAVAHGGTLRAVLAHLLPEQFGQWWTYGLNNCGLTCLRLTEGSPQVLLLNDTRHLGHLIGEETWIAPNAVSFLGRR